VIGGRTRSGYVFLDHTADVGIRAWGPSAAVAFQQAGIALVALMGATAHPPGRRKGIHVNAADREGLLVAFLDDLIYLGETETGSGVASLAITRLTPTSLDAEVEMAPLHGPSDGLVVKAATYHRLAVSEHSDGSAEVQVYLDV
jgi:SHS2 domain-containing protein